MRRVATHRVYHVNTGDWLSFPVLELDEAGNVVRIYPLAEEISHTEWLPGMIFVSPFFIERKGSEPFSVFFHRLNQEVACLPVSSLSCHAYWLTSFNLSALEFTSESRIIAL